MQRYKYFFKTCKNKTSERNFLIRMFNLSFTPSETFLLHYQFLCCYRTIIAVNADKINAFGKIAQINSTCLIWAYAIRPYEHTNARRIENFDALYHKIGLNVNKILCRIGINLSCTNCNKFSGSFCSLDQGEILPNKSLFCAFSHVYVISNFRLSFLCKDKKYSFKSYHSELVSFFLTNFFFR